MADARKKSKKKKKKKFGGRLDLERISWFKLTHFVIIDKLT